MFILFKENVKNVRKTLKILQKTADKENLTRHSNIDKDAKLATRYVMQMLLYIS